MAASKKTKADKKSTAEKAKEIAKEEVLVKEAEPVKEAAPIEEAAPVEVVAEEPKKRGGRPKGSVNKAKAPTTKKKEVAHTTVVEYGDNSVDVDDIVKKAEAAFKNDNKRKRYDEFFVYIKPEDKKAYYVAKYGDKEYKDSIPLF